MSIETHAQRGEFVPMQGGATPLEQAQIFNVSVASESGPARQFLNCLLLMEDVETQPAEDAKALSLASRLNKTAATSESAGKLREIFGEVEAEDRHYLPLVKVYFDLFHNQLEAEHREQTAREAAVIWIIKITHKIQERIRELEEQIQTVENQKEQDNHQKTVFQAGVEAGYQEAHSAGEKGLNQYQQIISKEKKEAAALEKEIESLRDLEQRLLRFCSCVHY